MIRILLALVSSVLLVLAMPPFSIGWMTWIAPAPLFAAIRLADSRREAANLAGLSGFVFYAVSLHWFWNIFGPAAVALWCLLALFFGLFGAAAWSFREPFLSLLVWPTLFLGVEYFRCETWPLAFPWLSLGSGLWTDPAASLARWIGVYGLTLLVAIAATALSLVVDPGRWARSAGPILAAILLAAARAGSGRVLIPVPPPSLRVALIQSEGFEDDTHARLIRQAGREEPRVIVLPEYSVFLPGGAVNEFTLERYQALARQTSAYLVLGVIEVDNRQTRGDNYALVLSPSGERIARYAKRRTVPFVEKMIRRGRDLVSFETEAGLLGLQICYDLDFSDGSRRLQEAGAILAPSMLARHWGRWPRLQHVALTSLRALESGRWIAKAASSGASVAVDPAGRIRRMLPVGATGVLIAEIGMASGATPYQLAGHRIGPAGLFLAALWILLAFLRSRLL